MKRVPGRFILGLLSLVVLMGCASDQIFLKSVKSPGVDHIPTKIGFFPFLSTPAQGAGGGLYVNFPLPGGSALNARIAKDNVVISPPANTNLLITQEGQMLTDLVTTSLATQGFSLKQLPVEMQEDKDPSHKTPRSFYISLELLNELKDKYGLEAIALGEAFFITERTYAGNSEARIVLAHVKIVDIKTLDVLAEVSTPYKADGIDLNQTSDLMTQSLAALAGMTPK